MPRKPRLSPTAHALIHELVLEGERRGLGSNRALLSHCPGTTGLDEPALSRAARATDGKLHLNENQALALAKGTHFPAHLARVLCVEPIDRLAPGQAGLPEAEIRMTAADHHLATSEYARALPLALTVLCFARRLKGDDALVLYVRASLVVGRCVRAVPRFDSAIADDFAHDAERIASARLAAAEPLREAHALELQLAGVGAAILAATLLLRRKRLALARFKLASVDSGPFAPAFGHARGAVLQAKIGYLRGGIEEVRFHDGEADARALTLSHYQEALQIYERPEVHPLAQRDHQLLTIDLARLLALDPATAGAALEKLARIPSDGRNVGARAAFHEARARALITLGRLTEARAAIEDGRLLCGSYRHCALFLTVAEAHVQIRLLQQPDMKPWDARHHEQRLASLVEEIERMALLEAIRHPEIEEVLARAAPLLRAAEPPRDAEALTPLPITRWAGAAVTVHLAFLLTLLALGAARVADAAEALSGPQIVASGHLGPNAPQPLAWSGPVPRSAIHVPDHGIHVPDDGIHVPDHGIHVPDHGIHVPDDGIHVPNHGIHVPDHGIHVPDGPRAHRV